jgi:hypothetical protein
MGGYLSSRTCWTRTASTVKQFYQFSKQMKTTKKLVFIVKTNITKATYNVIVRVAF